MITLTFEPTCPEQAALLGKFLPEYMALGCLTVTGEPEAVKSTIDTALAEQQRAAAEQKLLDKMAQAAEEKPAKKPRAAKSAASALTDTAPAPSEPSPSPSSPAATAPTVEVTLEQVRAKLAALSQAGKAATVKDLIAGYGVAKLTDVPKDKYAELLAAAEGL